MKKRLFALALAGLMVAQIPLSTPMAVYAAAPDGAPALTSAPTTDTGDVTTDPDDTTDPDAGITNGSTDGSSTSGDTIGTPTAGGDAITSGTLGDTVPGSGDPASDDTNLDDENDDENKDDELDDEELDDEELEDFEAGEAEALGFTTDTDYSDATIITTKEDGYQYVRDVIRNRTNNNTKYGGNNNTSSFNNYVYDRFLVAQGVYSSTGGTIQPEKVYDFSAERTGMEPYEGDYISNLIADSESYVTETFDPMGPILREDGPGNVEAEYTTIDGVEYEVFHVYLPIITTSEQENAVDAKVVALLNPDTGAFKDVLNGTREQKVRAIMSYISRNISGTVPGDRRTPIYHTAYHALVNRSGTCQGLAMAFYRLSRALDVPCKVLMGTDANAHTYTIVQMEDNKWYYCDPSSSGVILKGSNSFSPAPLQGRYAANTEYTRNYLERISTTNYGQSSTDPKVFKLERVSGETSEVLDEYTDLRSLVDGILMDYKSTNSTDSIDWTMVSYTITLLADATTAAVSLDDLYDIGDDESEYINDVSDDTCVPYEINLNGHTLTVTSNMTLRGNLNNGSAASAGKVYVKGDRLSFTVQSVCSDITIKDVEISFSKNNNFRIGYVTVPSSDMMEIPLGEYPHKTVVTNTKILNPFQFWVGGRSFVDSNCTISVDTSYSTPAIVFARSNVVIESDHYLTAASNTAVPVVLAPINIENTSNATFVAELAGTVVVNDVIANGSNAELHLNDADVYVLGRIQSAKAYLSTSSNEYDDETGKLFAEPYEKITLATKDGTSSFGSFTISNSLRVPQDENITTRDYRLTFAKASIASNGLTADTYTGSITPTSVEFASGELVATLPTSVPVPAYDSDDETESKAAISSDSGANLAAYREASNSKTVRAYTDDDTVSIAQINEKDSPVDGTEKTYKSIKQAITALNNKTFGDSNVRVQLKLLESNSLTTDLTIPSFVDKIVICSDASAESGYKTLDLNGHSLTYAGSGEMILLEGVNYRSSASTSGKIMLTGTPVFPQGMNTATTGLVIVGHGLATPILKNVDISINNNFSYTCLDLVSNDLTTNVSKLEKVNINGGHLYSRSGKWTIDGSASVFSATIEDAKTEKSRDSKDSELTLNNLTITRSVLYTLGVLTVDKLVLQQSAHVTIGNYLTENAQSSSPLDGELIVHESLSTSGNNVICLNTSGSKFTVRGTDGAGHTTGTLTMNATKLMNNGTVDVADIVINSSYKDDDGKNYANYTVANYSTGKFSANSLNMKGGVFCNIGSAQIDNVISIAKLDNHNGATFTASEFTTPATAAMYLEPGSILHIEDSATINNIYLGQTISGDSALGDAIITRAADAEVSINGKVVAYNSTYNRLRVGIVGADKTTIQSAVPGTVLFTTGMKDGTFPSELITVEQPSVEPPSPSSKFTSVYQNGSQLIVSQPTFVLRELTSIVDNSNGGDITNYTDIGTYASWGEVVNKINSLKKSGAEYKVSLIADVGETAAQPLPMPTYMKSLTIYGGKPATDNEGHINYSSSNGCFTFSTKGNVTFTANTVFDGVVWIHCSDNGSSGILNLNGKNLRLNYASMSGAFSEIKGNGSSIFELNNSTVDLPDTRATSLKQFYMTQSGEEDSQNPGTYKYNKPVRFKSMAVTNFNMASGIFDIEDLTVNKSGILQISRVTGQQGNLLAAYPEPQFTVSNTLTLDGGRLWVANGSVRKVTINNLVANSAFPGEGKRDAFDATYQCTVDNFGKINITGSVNMKAGIFANSGCVEMPNVDANLFKLETSKGSAINAKSITVNPKGAAYLHPGSEIYVHADSVITNLYLNQWNNGTLLEDVNPAQILRSSADVRLEINGAVNSKVPVDKTKLNLGVGTYTINPSPAATDPMWYTFAPTTMTNGTMLCATNIKDGAFPVGIISLLPTDADYSELEVYQDGSAVMLSKTNVKITNSTTDEFANAVNLRFAIEKINKAPGDYTITILDNTTLGSDITIPSCVQNLTFTAADGKAIDFNGHMITYSGKYDVAVNGRLKLVNSDPNKHGTIKLSASNTTFGVYVSDMTDADVTSGAVTVINGVDVSVAGGTVELATTNTDEKTYEIADSTITAKTICTTYGNYHVAAASGVQLINNSINTLESVSHSLYCTTLHIGTLNGSGTVVSNGSYDYSTNPASVNNAYIRIDNLMSKNAVLSNLDGSVMMVGKAASISKIVNMPYAICEVDDITMNSNGIAYLEPDSVFHVNDKATLCNVYLGQDAAGNAVSGADPASLTRAENASITINGKLERKGNADTLVVVTVNTSSAPYAETYTAPQTILFNTNIKTFPVDMINLYQPSTPVDYTKYNTLMQVGNNVIVATDWIDLYASDTRTSLGQKLISFAKWSDAIAYVNTLSEPRINYTLVLKEDVTTCENLTFPATNKINSLRLMGDSTGSPIMLTYVGNIALSTDTTFENIILNPQTYNSKTNVYSDNNSSTINLNGKELALVNSYSDATFASLSGSGNSLLRLDCIDESNSDYMQVKDNGDKMKLTVTGAFNVANLVAENYDIQSVTNALTVGNQAYLTSASLECKTNMTFKDLHTLDPYNTLSYAEAANNSLKINGVVDSIGENGADTGADVDVTVGTAFATVNTNAIDITVKYIENAQIATSSNGKTGSAGIDGTATAVLPAVAYGKSAYTMTHYNYDAKKGNVVTKINTDYTTKPLAVSAKGAANYFLIDKTVTTAGNPAENTYAARYATQKQGNNILVLTGEQLGNLIVTLKGKTLRSVEGQVYTTMVELGKFATLQEALTEIDRYADKNGVYTVVINSAVANAQTGKEKTDVSYNGANLTLPKQAKSVTITTLDPDTAYTKLYTNNALNLNSDLTLQYVEIMDNLNNKGVNTKLNANLGSYTLTLDDVSFESGERIGNVTGKGILELDGTDLTVTGNVNVNELKGSVGDTLTGTATIKTAKDKATGELFIQSVTPNITVNGAISGIIDIQLTANGALITPDFVNAYPNGAAFVSAATPAFCIVKAPAADPGNITYDGSATHLIKNNGFICYSEAPLAYSLYKGSIASENKMADMITFADVVTEINNRNDSKADYVIATAGNASNIAEPFAMPKATALQSLTIQGTAANGTALSGDATAPLFYGNTKNGVASGSVSKFTFTTDTIIKNISFVDREQYNATANKNTEIVFDLDYGKVGDVMARPARIPVSLAMSGKTLTVDNVRFEGRGLLIDGGKNGVLTIETGGLRGFNGTNSGSSMNIVEGQISNLKELIVKPAALTMTKYASAVGKDGNPSAFKPAGLTVTDLSLNGTTISVCDSYDYKTGVFKYDATTTITNLSMEGTAGILSRGKMTLTNVTASGDNDMTLSADRDFNIKGALRNTGHGLQIEGRRKKDVDAKTAINAIDSFINISGEVVCTGADNYMAITLYPYVGDEPLTLEDGEMMRLATVPKGSMHQFISGNVDSSSNAFQTIKLGNFIYATDGAAINVAVVETDDYTDIFSVADDYTVSDVNGTPDVDAFGYYPTLADAVTAINAVNVAKGAVAPQYVIVLLGDEGTQDVPVKVAFPNAGKTSGVGLITDADADQNAVLYYNNELSLNSNMSFSDVMLAPTKTAKAGNTTVGQGTKLNLKLGNYQARFAYSSGSGSSDNDVILDGYEGASIGNITSNKDAVDKKTGAFTAQPGLELIDTNLSATGEVNIANYWTVDSQLTVVGPATTDDKGNVTKKTNLKTTINNIFNDAGSIVVDRGSFTITGTITNNGSDEFGISVDATDAEIKTAKDGSPLYPDGCLLLAAEIDNKTSLADKKLFTGANVSARDLADNDTNIYSDATVTIAEGSGTPLDSETILKLGNDFYYVDDALTSNMVVMNRYDASASIDPYTKVPEGTDHLLDSSRYIDVNAALAQINTWGDTESMYVITIEDDITDVNVRDKNDHSALSMPGNNKAGCIIFDNPDQSMKQLCFSGALTAYAGFTKETESQYDGGLVFNNLYLDPVKASNDKAGRTLGDKQNITLNRNGNDKAGYPELRFYGTQLGGFGQINNVSGTAKFTDVYSDYGSVIAGNLSNIHQLTVEDSTFGVEGSVSNLNYLYLNHTESGEHPDFITIGTATIDNLMVNKGTRVCLSTKVDNTKNNTTIKETVIAVDNPYNTTATDDPVIWILPVKTTAKTVEGAVDNSYNKYTDQNLINAPKADARFFTLDQTHDPGDAHSSDYAPYKSGNAVLNGNLDNMNVEIIRTADEAAGVTGYDSYAKTYADAVTIIGSMAVQGDYTIKFLNKSTADQIAYTTGKNGVAAFGAMAFPAYKAAKSVTITSNAGEAIEGSSPATYGATALQFSGNLTPATNVVFDNITLNNGAVKGGIFTPLGGLTVAMTTGYDMTFTENAKTVNAAGNPVSPVDITKKSGAKGILRYPYKDAGNTIRTAFYVNGVCCGYGDQSAEFSVLKLAHDGKTVYMESWASAVNYINARNDKTADYEITLLKDLYSSDGVAPGDPAKPMDSFVIPAAAHSITITDDDDAHDLIIPFKGNALNVQTNLILDDIAVYAYSYNNKTKEYTDNPYNISIGANFTLTLTSDGQGARYGGYGAGQINQITGGSLYITGDDWSNNRNEVIVNKVVTVKNLIVEGAELYVEKGNLTVQTTTDLTSAGLVVIGNASLKDATMSEETVVAADNITMTGNTCMEDSTLAATASETVGTGKLTIANLTFTNAGETTDLDTLTNTLEAKQDKNGVSQLSITGKVIDARLDTLDEGMSVTDTYKPAYIRVLYNNQSRYNDMFRRTDSVLYDGMVFASFGNANNARDYAGLFGGMSGWNFPTDIIGSDEGVLVQNTAPKANTKQMVYQKTAPASQP